MTVKIKHQVNQSTPAWQTLSGSALSLALSEWQQHHDGMTCVITPNLRGVQRIQDELTFFQSNHTVNATPILSFPDWETLPYDRFSPHQDIISERLATLSKLNTLKKGILVTALPTVMHRLPSYDFIAAHSFNLTVGETINIETFRERLTKAGYSCVTKVMEHGEYAIRGSIIDIYPMGNPNPFRLDLFDNDIESIRLFDVDTQRSSEKVEKIKLLPAREFPLDEKGMTQFRQSWRNHFEGNPTRCPLYNDVSEGMAPAGIEYYLPLFFNTPTGTLPTLLDYLPKNTVFFLVDEQETLIDAGDKFFHEVNERYTQRRHDITTPLLSPDELFVPWETLKRSLHTFDSEIISVPYLPPAMAIDVTIQRQIKSPLAKLQYSIENEEKCPEKQRILICAQTAGRRELLHEQLSHIGIRPKLYTHWIEFIKDNSRVGLIQGPLETGFSVSAKSTHPAFTVITETQIWGETFVQQRKSPRRNLDVENIIRDLGELQIGAAVVHIEYGVGRYLGLQNLEHDNQINEFLTLSYAGGDKIYVPVTSLNKISRYTGLDPEHAPLHKLGNDLWQREKKKAQEKIHDAAIELLEIYAKREARVGYAYAAPDNDYQTFAAAFPFEETPDQKTAIEQVIQDMQSSRPMDRLICGDVGFGKTEVAMRACFLAVQSHKQVCILVPTTLLAGQHYENFCDRFADFGVTIELLSRFCSPALVNKTIEGLQTGRVDIVIGTHKLFSKSIVFQNLGLLIIDEEHRFGVKQKESIKKLRHEVDILSLTATPIPRTLNMSLSGLRDISVIATPPLRRLAIKTFALEKNDAQVREAVLREIMRGGQVFYLHNQVSSIENTARELRQLLPEASIEVAHGQMPERQLEKVMSDFYHRRFQVLVCSTIIETGIDIPTANTMIIERADRFGLAQLHQLRGRVGRSHHQAYAYLLTPHQDAMTPDAKKRLDAILSIEDLGAGFTLATHDLEIRGAGELLGEDQSGNMHTIGFSLYMELLNEAVETLKSGKVPELDKSAQQDPEINLHISLIIPENYLPDTHMRLIFYKRIAHAENTNQLEELQVEMIDRFGLLPNSVKNFFHAMELKFTAQKLGIKKITTHVDYAKIEFGEHPNIKPETIIVLIQTQPKTYRLEGPSKLRYQWPVAESKDVNTPVDVIQALFQLLQRLEK